MVAMGIRLVYIIMYIVYVPPSGNALPKKLSGDVLPTKVNGSIIITYSVIPGSKNEYSVPQGPNLNFQC